MNSTLEVRCVNTANRLSEQFRRTNPPFPLEPLLQHFKVTEVRERPLDRDACLRLDSGGFLIEVNSLYPPAVRRLGIAHEIGHLIVSHCSQHGHSHWGHHDKRIEDLCDRLAGLLLAPDWAVCWYLRRDRRPSGRRGRIGKPTLRRVASAFGMPVKAMSCRVVQELNLAHAIAE
jgi:Zn-dependent peptidase ImmA (M78 family)